MSKNLELIVENSLKEIIESFFQTKIQFRLIQKKVGENGKSLFLQGDAPHPESTVYSIINFSGGDFSGGVSVAASVSTTLKLARAFCDCPVGSMIFLSPEARDAFGEFANLLSGNIKMGIEKKGQNIVSSPPYILSGNDLNLWISEEFEVYRSYVASNIGNFIVELVIGGVFEL